MKLRPIAPHITQFICEVEPAPKRGRPRNDPQHATTNVERARKAKTKKKEIRHKSIAVLDFETDPFDNIKQDKVEPFTACLYSDDFEPVIIWEENFKAFVAKVVAAIVAMPGEYTIYAHNGGRFDFMFLISEMRGSISFKGRGIMAAKIGNHHLRDSFHLIPEKLAAYQKDVFDYKKLYKGKRRQHREEIIRYMTNDCIYLLDLVKKFVGDFGLKLSIGQAAMSELKKHYQVEKISDGWDNYLRDYFFGGRVECLKGRGHFKGPWKLIDVNSMYPRAMAAYQHPIAGMFGYKLRQGPPTNETVFVDLTCENRGALIGRDEEGATTANIPYGRFKTTIWEYEVALKYNLISNVKIHLSLDCFSRTNFSNFIVPMYDKRQVLKEHMKLLDAQGLRLSQEFIETKKDDMFYKFLLNNSYGKFAQNPRRFKEHYITEPNDQPPETWFKTIPKDRQLEFCQPEFEHAQYWIWSKPAPSYSFNNVGTAASITGAARAILLEALQIVDTPIYCDTDSIICRGTGNLELHPSNLGAWDLEDEFKSVAIAGKKMYSVEHMKPKKRSVEDLARGISPDFTVKLKGAQGVVHSEILDMISGKTVSKTNFGPTLTRYGMQTYITRTLRATAPILEN